MTQPHTPVTRADQLSFSGPPFREFTGKLVDIEFPIERQRPKSKLQFTEMKVLRTIAPYPHPAGELSFNRTGRNGEAPSDRSPWGRLILSSQAQGHPDILDLVGHTLHITSSEQKIDADPETGREAGSFLYWDIVAVDGHDARPKPVDASNPVSVPDPKTRGTSSPSNGIVTEDELLTLLDGKTLGEFVVAAVNLNLTLPAKLRARLLDSNDLIPGWIQAGKVTTDGNTYTRVKA